MVFGNFLLNYSMTFDCFITPLGYDKIDVYSILNLSSNLIATAIRIDVTNIISGNNSVYERINSNLICIRC